MAIKDVIAWRLDMYRVDPKTLVEEPGWNVRQAGAELDAHIRWLADSIKTEGVKEPLTCYLKKEGETESLVVTNGHCRLLATRLAISEGAEILTVPVRVEDRYSNEGDRILSMILRNSGRPLTQLETAEVCKRLLKFGWDMNQVSTKTGYSIHHIQNILELSNAPDELLQIVKDGQVSSTLAGKMVREKGTEEAVKVLKDAVETSKTAGKKKATAKDIEKIKSKKVPWNQFGPRLYKLMKEIYETPAPERQKVWQYIAEAGEVLGEIEEIQGSADSI